MASGYTDRSPTHERGCWTASLPHTQAVRLDISISGQHPTIASDAVVSYLLMDGPCCRGTRSRSSARVGWMIITPRSQASNQIPALFPFRYGSNQCACFQRLRHVSCGAGGQNLIEAPKPLISCMRRPFTNVNFDPRSSSLSRNVFSSVPSTPHITLFFFFSLRTPTHALVTTSPSPYSGLTRDISSQCLGSPGLATMGAPLPPSRHALRIWQF